MNVKPLNNRALIQPIDIDPDEPDFFADVQKSRHSKARILAYSTFNEAIEKELGDVKEIDYIVIESHMMEKIKVGTNVVYTIPINAIVAKVLLETKDIDKSAKKLVSLLVKEALEIKNNRENIS